MAAVAAWNLQLQSGFAEIGFESPLSAIISRISQRIFSELSFYSHEVFTFGGRLSGWGCTMLMLRTRLRAAAETIAGVLYSAGFLLLWLCCWPLYRLVRSR